MNIGIFGEAVIDLIPKDDGSYVPHVGGSPFNVARAIGLQGVKCTYLSPLSSDRFGDLLAETLQSDQVDTDADNRSSMPTSIAVASFSPSGQPQYSLYRQGIADRDYSMQTVIDHSLDRIDVLHTGSLALVPDEIDRTRTILEEAKKRGKLISVDVNMRPSVVKDLQTYIDSVNDVLPLCDLVKASNEDLEILGLSASYREICSDLKQRANATLAVVTLGESGSIAAVGDDQVYYPGFKVEKIGDTIGAGDCFMAGLLCSLAQQDYLNIDSLPNVSKDHLLSALCQASATASLNVMQHGCHPPTEEELRQFLLAVD